MSMAGYTPKGDGENAPFSERRRGDWCTFETKEK
jgi:hypothetical protein